MKIEIELNQPVMEAILIIHKATGMPINEVIQRSVVSGLQYLNTSIEFAKAQNKNAKAGIDITKEPQ